MKKVVVFALSLFFSTLFVNAQPFGCNLQAIRNAFTAAGYTELTGVQGQPCSLYFINPTSQDANLSEAAAQQLGAHLVVFNDAAENTAVVNALNAAGIISSVDAVWVGYTDQVTEGTWVTLDGTPMTYLNWASGEPNNNGQGSSCCGIPDWLGGCQSSEAWRCQYGEDCAQIYSSGQWNDLPCNRNSVSVIEVNLCPDITTTVPPQPVCANYQTHASATAILGSQPYTWVWNELPSGTQVGTASSINVTPTGTTSYQVQVTDRWGCYALDTATITAQVCTGPPGCDLIALRQAFAAAGYNELNGVVGQPCSLYFINPQSQDANQSELDARQLGAHLVVFNDAAENTAVVNALNASGVIASVGAVWVGYTDQAVEGTWVTLDGTPMTYLNWASGEPNNNGQGASCCSFPDWLGGCSSSQAFRCQYGEDCAQIYSAGSWNDLPCNTNSVSVIEVNLCPQITTNNDTVMCGGNPLTLSASTLLGSTPYTYSWNPGNYSANPVTVNPVVSTLYTVTVTDRWGCFDDDTVNVTINGGGVQSFTIYPNPVCINRTTAVTYTGTGAAGANYTWGFDGGTVVSGSGQGPYQVMWTTGGTKNVTLDVNDNGCISPQVSQQVTINNNPVADAGPDVTVCSGGIVQLGTASTAGYTYQWFPPNNLNNDTISNPIFSASNLTANPVTIPIAVAVTQFACYNTDTVNVTVNPPAATTITPSGNIPVCSGGTITLNPDSVYVTYIWSDSSTANSLTVTQPGSYFMAAIAANGCQYISNTINVTYNPPASSSISASGPTDFCQGGAVTLTSDSVYNSYLWSTAATANNITVSSSGAYSMSGIDAAGCNYASNVINVTVNPLPVLSLGSSTDVSCFGLSDGTITASTSSGTPAYNYVWATTPPQFTATATGLAAGSYTVVVADSKNCGDTATYAITEPQQLVLNGAVTDVSCFYAIDGAVVLTLTGGSTPYNYSWSNGNSGANLQNVAGGNYDVTVSDANSCSVTSTFVVNGPAPITVQSLEFDSIKFGTEVSLNLDVQPAGSYTYQWNPGNYLSCTDCASPSFYATRSMNYNVTVTDANGCSITTAVSVNVLADKPVFIPNAFTPNGDGANDLWSVYATGTAYYNMQVFNRWGEMVYQSFNINAGWDGRYKGKEADPGVYVYVLQLTFLDSETKKYTGSFTLMK